jgi:hypothetical protein
MVTCMTKVWKEGDRHSNPVSMVCFSKPWGLLSLTACFLLQTCSGKCQEPRSNLAPHDRLLVPNTLQMISQATGKVIKSCPFS